jgi:GNAT superfamily N-acetyltransferase
MCRATIARVALSSGWQTPVVDSVALPAGYRLADGPPSVADYLLLRERAGLTPKREDQAQAALGGSWAAVHVLHEADGKTVGMGRLLGDSGWYFHVVDMAVLPEHQRRGLGDVILTALLERIRRAAPAGAHVNLLADPPGRRLYARHGFTPTAPGSVGMARMLN